MADTMQGFIKEVENRFGLDWHLEKYKAGHVMGELWLDREMLCSSDITGPGCGHTTSYGQHHCFTVFGWAYALTDDGWELLADGLVGFREGASPFPNIT